jgi:PKHD-type hydroxylase
VDNYIIRKICNDEQITEIQNLIKISNENNYWCDGLLSLTGKGEKKRTIKNNLELSDSQISHQINSMIMFCLDNDLVFLNMTVANQTFQNIISKTESGGYYHPHIDSYSNGDYSTTVFLNDPSEYEGGELCLYLNNEEKKIKLDPGWAVTYKTGILHRVNRVISGIRYVSVCWTKSKIKDDFTRNICSELLKISKLIEDKQIDDLCSINFEGAIKSPTFLTKNLINEIIRKYGQF